MITHEIELRTNHSPQVWIRTILEQTRGFRCDVARRLVGARLAKAFPTFDIPNPPPMTDTPVGYDGDFFLSINTFYVSAAPNISTVRACARDVAAGLQPLLLVPGEKYDIACALAEIEGIEKSLVVQSIETFISLYICSSAIAEGKDDFTILKEIIDLYNQRLKEVETDLSLKIEIR